VARPVIVVAGDEGSLLFWFFLFGVSLMLCFGFFHIVKEIDDLFGSVLDDAHKVDFFVFAIADHLGDAGTKFSVFFRSLGKVGNIMPKLAAVLEVYEKLSDVGVGALEGIAEDLARSVGLQFDVYGGVAALGERDGL
jgi:hypothetical protein